MLVREDGRVPRAKGARPYWEQKRRGERGEAVRVSGTCEEWLPDGFAAF